MSGILVNSAAVYLATDKLEIYYLYFGCHRDGGIHVVEFHVDRSAGLSFHQSGRQVAKRVGVFFVMNLIALALRSPMIYLMTTIMGIYYVISNLFSLVLLTVLRFVFADRLIWGKTSRSQLQPHRLQPSGGVL